MRPEAFTSTERGVARKTVDGYVAFFPEPVPRRILLPSEVMVLLDEATGAVHRLGGIGRLIPNPHLLYRPAPADRGGAELENRGHPRAMSGGLLRFEAGQVRSLSDAGTLLEVKQLHRWRWNTGSCASAAPGSPCRSGCCASNGTNAPCARRSRATPPTG